MILNRVALDFGCRPVTPGLANDLQGQKVAPPLIRLTVVGQEEMGQFGFLDGIPRQAERILGQKFPSEALDGLTSLLAQQLVGAFHQIDPQQRLAAVLGHQFPDVGGQPASSATLKHHAVGLVHLFILEQEQQRHMLFEVHVFLRIRRRLLLNVGECRIAALREARSAGLRCH